MALVALAGVATLVAVATWWARGRALLLAALLLVSVLAVAGAVRLWGDAATGGAEDALLVAAAALAVAGGGPLTVAVFSLVDRGKPAVDSVESAGAVLRGGAWIGGLERAAVFLTLVAGWPEGVAVVLGLKGLGRYPELKGPEQPSGSSLHGVAERFIIGTAVSVLWAVACAGLTTT